MPSQCCHVEWISAILTDFEPWKKMLGTGDRFWFCLKSLVFTTWKVFKNEKICFSLIISKGRDNEWIFFNFWTEFWLAVMFPVPKQGVIFFHFVFGLMESQVLILELDLSWASAVGARRLWPDEGQQQPATGLGSVGSSANSSKFAPDKACLVSGALKSRYRM